MDPSIFSRIVKGEIPSHTVYEDVDSFAFLDIHPLSKGHVLVVPKRQVEFIWDLSDVEYQALMETVKKVGLRLREVLQVPYVGLKVVGEDVPHAHVHVIPFKDSAVMQKTADMATEPDHAVLAKVAEAVAF